MKKCILLSLPLLLCLTACQAQTPSTSKYQADKQVGGPCEGCEAIFEYGDRNLTTVDTLPDFETEYPKLMITGTVYHKDGKSPAEGIILYVYQTNRAGIYESLPSSQGWERRHGYIRGWVKTGSDGRYTFYTFRPGAYPNRREAEHIHLTIKEPGKTAYYVDNYVFDDDPLLTQQVRMRLDNRAGSGIVMPEKKGNIFHIQRDLILGLNIPGYDQ